MGAMRFYLVGSVLVVAVLFVAAEICLGIWTYRDARSRGLNAALWTVVALLVPSFVGLILYLTVGRNQASGLCPGCSAAVQADALFCPRCGAAVGGEGGEAPSARPLPRVGKGWLIAFFVCVALMLLYVSCFSMFGVYRHNPNFGGFSSHISIGSVERSVERRWSLSFHSFTGRKENGALNYDGTAPASVHVKSSLAGGKLELVLTQGDTRVVADLSGPQVESDIGLGDFAPGRIRMTLTGENARGGDVEVTWD